MTELPWVIQGFVQSNRASAWAYLDKTEVLAGMVARLGDPLQVKQGGQPFCGPAAVLFELIRKHPVRYVELCRGLFETGQYQGRCQTLRASQRLRHRRGDLRMAPVDWLVLATLRDHSNWLVPVNPRSPRLLRELSGITVPWEITAWMRNLLDYDQVRHYHTPWGGEAEALALAQGAIEQGGVAMALIDQGLLDYKVPCLSYPNHWVSLLGNVQVRTKGCFDCYSWGRQITLRGDWSELKKHLWGVTIAQAGADLGG
jgi:hypothetical protein